MDIEVARGAQVRARARCVEEGETSSAFFLRLEKKRAADRSVAALRTNDGSIVSHNEDLCRVFSSFFESSFTAAATDPAIANSLLSNVSSTLPSTQADPCDGPLSFDECFAALNGMARGKSPGSDGLPMEFYVKFWPILGTDLVNVLNLCYLSGVMSLTQRRGLISLIFKKGDCLDPRNWRPITLLNVDYKLASKGRRWSFTESHSFDCRERPNLQCSRTIVRGKCVYYPRCCFFCFSDWCPFSHFVLGSRESF